MRPKALCNFWCHLMNQPVKLGDHRSILCVSETGKYVSVNRFWWQKWVESASNLHSHDIDCCCTGLFLDLHSWLCEWLPMWMTPAIPHMPISHRIGRLQPYSSTKVLPWRAVRREIASTDMSCASDHSLCLKERWQ